MIYSCDLGSWDKGYTVAFEASNHDEAIAQASKIARDDGEYLVQVRAAPYAPGPIIWDEVVGKYKEAH